MNPHRTAQANEAALRKVLTQRTLVALSKQNVAFVLEHQNDTWQELSQYLARCQAALGRAPARTEVIGGRLHRAALRQLGESARQHRHPGRRPPVHTVGRKHQALPRRI